MLSISLYFTNIISRVIWHEDSLADSNIDAVML